uniref:Uncharacterized protein n=1 Tax=Arundo donax TaxID=35708 RepID=A0A0A9CPH5_ARUDO
MIEYFLSLLQYSIQDLLFSTTTTDLFLVILYFMFHYYIWFYISLCNKRKVLRLATMLEIVLPEVLIFLRA